MPTGLNLLCKVVHNVWAQAWGSPSSFLSHQCNACLVRQRDWWFACFGFFS